MREQFSYAHYGWSAIFQDSAQEKELPLSTVEPEGSRLHPRTYVIPRRLASVNVLRALEGADTAVHPFNAQPFSGLSEEVFGKKNVRESNLNAQDEVAKQLLRREEARGRGRALKKLLDDTWGAV